MAKNNTPLNIEKVVSFIKEDIFSKEYHCPYTDAAIVLETLRKLHEEHDLKWIEKQPDIMLYIATISFKTKKRILNIIKQPTGYTLG